MCRRVKITHTLLLFLAQSKKYYVCAAWCWQVCLLPPTVLTEWHPQAWPSIIVAVIAATRWHKPSPMRLGHTWSKVKHLIQFALYIINDIRTIWCYKLCLKWFKTMYNNLKSPSSSILLFKMSKSAVWKLYLSTTIDQYGADFRFAPVFQSILFVLNLAQ